MSPEEFVRNIDTVVRQGAVSSTLADLARPPGRKPPTELVLLARWFDSLGDTDRECVLAVARLSLTHATCAFLSVIDGAMAIEPGFEKGHLELYYVKEGNRVLLNDPAAQPLNDKFPP